MAKKLREKLRPELNGRVVTYLAMQSAGFHLGWREWGSSLKRHVF